MKESFLGSTFVGVSVENETPEHQRHRLDACVGYFIMMSVFYSHVEVQAGFKTEAKDAETNRHFIESAGVLSGDRGDAVIQDDDVVVVTGV